MSVSGCVRAETAEQCKQLLIKCLKKKNKIKKQYENKSTVFQLTVKMKIRELLRSPVVYRFYGLCQKKRKQVLVEVKQCERQHVLKNKQILPIIKMTTRFYSCYHHRKGHLVLVLMMKVTSSLSLVTTYLQQQTLL